MSLLYAWFTLIVQPIWYTAIGLYFLDFYGDTVRLKPKHHKIINWIMCICMVIWVLALVAETIYQSYLK